MNCLKISDAFCYICRSVLIEPVTVPCSHVFCFTCFERSMQETSYSCPLCRKRISNWVRTAKKTDKLVNRELWMQIKEQFKDQVFSKLRGEDDGLDERLQEECPASSTISNPGEVAQEFSKLMNDFRDEEEKRRQAEEEASKELILRIKEEEHEDFEDYERDRLALEQDEEIARRIQEEINKETPPTSNSTTPGKQQNSSKKAKKVSKGPMDNFLKASSGKPKNGFKPLFLNNSIDNRCASTDSTDSIQSEMHHFQPIKVVPRTPPKLRSDGKIVEIGLRKVTPLKLFTTKKLEASIAKRLTIPIKKIHSPYSAFIGKGLPANESDSHESPRKRLRFSSDETESGVLKEITLGENSGSKLLCTTEADCKAVGDDNSKKKRISPSIISKTKSAQSNILVPIRMFNFDAMETSTTEETENDQFDTQDYLTPEPTVEEKLIEEQRRIEQLILQEKADRELALKLSREWDRRYELRKKPTTRNSKGYDNKKLQQTLLDTLVTKRKK